MSKIASPLTLALLVLELALLALLVSAAWRGTQTSQLLATQARAVATPKNVLGTPSRSLNLDPIQDGALLYASRHYFVPPVTDASAVPPPTYRLVGTFIIPNRPAVALLSSPTGVSRKVTAGDSLDGWTVEAVDARRVELKHGTEGYELTGLQGASASGMQPRTVPSPSATAAQPGTIRQLGSGGIQTVHSRATAQEPRITPRIYQAPPK